MSCYLALTFVCGTRGVALLIRFTFGYLTGLTLKIVVCKGKQLHGNCGVYYALLSVQMQVPLHLLCDDLLLYQEVTGNMYKLY